MSEGDVVEGASLDVATAGSSESVKRSERVARLYDTLVPVVFGYCRARVPLHDAEDVTAEVFRAVVERLEADPGAEVNRQWVLTVARNRIVDRWRRERRWRPRLAALAATERTRAVEAPPGDHRESEVVVALDTLPVAQRAALLLHHVDGHTVAEVADLIGRSPRAVESLLARGRRKLAAVVEARPAHELVGGVDG